MKNVKTVVLSKGELVEWISNIPITPVVVMLLGGDRLSCCDEAVALKVKEEIVGVATIAPKGEQMSGQPTIVALYILPKYRKTGYGKLLMTKTVERCQERGFEKIQVDVLSKRIFPIIKSLPPESQSRLEVNDMTFGDVTDWLAGQEEKN